jgi:LacI family transcriptional regulator
MYPKGELGPVATLYDVARLSGVSTATVSRVLHGQDRVRETTRTKVQKAIEELGYVPDGAAQSLSRRRKDVIGLICIERPTHEQDVENMNLTYTDELLRGVEGRIRDLDWSLLIRFWNGVTDPDFARLSAMSGKVDGVLISEGSIPARLVERIASRVPVAVIAGAPAERAVDVVTADNFSGSVAVVTHLVEAHGRRRLFHLDGPPTAPDATQRRLGLEEVIRLHPTSRLVGSARGSFSVESGLKVGERILTRSRITQGQIDHGWIGHGHDDLPDAIVAANDQMAIGLLRAFARAGIRVPEDVAVVGFDDIFPDNLCEPPLTTVHQPMRMLGSRACDRLLERIADPGLPPIVQLLPTELVLRESCGCLAGPVTRQPVRPASSSVFAHSSALFAAPAALE